MAVDGFMAQAYARSHVPVNTLACLPPSGRPPQYADVNTLARNLRLLLGDMSENQLSDATGIPQPTINRILRGLSRDPRDRTLLPIADYFGVTIEALRRGKHNGDVPVPVSRIETPPGYVRFQLMGEAGAGPGMQNTEHPEVVREVSLAEWRVREALGSMASPERVKLLTVRGDSMAPRIRSGDVVFVDVKADAYEGDGNYVVILHGFAMVKRLELRTDGLHIVSLADPDRPDVVQPDDIQSVHIAGRVLGALQIRRASEL